MHCMRRVCTCTEVNQEGKAPKIPFLTCSAGGYVTHMEHVAPQDMVVVVSMESFRSMPMPHLLVHSANPNTFSRGTRLPAPSPILQ